MFFYSENAEKAKAVVKAFREKEVVNRFSFIWLGITVEDINQPSDESTNSFVFSDGTKFDDSNFVFRWMADTMAGGHPNYSDKDIRCTIVKDESGEVMMSTFCSGGANAHGLCKTYEKCEDENSANSESERSRANLPVFALFMACSVFKTFYALVGIDF